MDRLRDQEQSNDPDVAFAAKAIATREPAHVDPLMRQRLRAKLLSGAPIPRPARAFRPAFVITMTLLLVSAAITVIGRSLLQRPRPPASERMLPESRPAPTTPPPPATRLSETAPTPTATPIPEPIPTPKLTPKLTPRVTNAPARERPRRSTTPAPLSTDQPSTVGATTLDEESSLVASAYRALRQSHDAALALQLLDAYANKFPAGMLVEEALALRIEALLSRNDPRARALGAEYLRTYPFGRFRQTALRARDLDSEKVPDR